jgi:hydrogenase large subunit
VTKAPDARDRVRIIATLRAFRRHLEAELFGAPLETFAAIETVSDLEAWNTGDAGLFLRISADLQLEKMGQGPGRYLSFGAYPLAEDRTTAQGVFADGAAQAFNVEAVQEDVAHSWMLGDTRHPSKGVTQPDEAMRDSAYSWCKAPRLSGQPMEVGALARGVVDGHKLALALSAEDSVRARIVGRLLEVARTQIWLETWAEQLDPTARFMGSFDLPKTATGFGLVEAARGSLGHWLEIEDGMIANYQIIAPTTWNFSPRDAAGVPGPLEAALVGAPVAEGEKTPLSVQHIVRSYDPCMVCTVH